VKTRLFVIWILSLAATLVLGGLLVGLYRQSTTAQLDRAAEAVAEACEQIAQRYGYYAAGWAGPGNGDGTPASADPTFRADLSTVLALALDRRQGLEGGVVDQSGRPLASTFTPDEDTTRTVAALVAELGSEDPAASTRIATGDSTVMLHACALPGPVPGLAGWALARVPDAPGQDRLRLGLGVLLALAVGMAALLGWVVVSWARRIGTIEAALARHAAGALPHLAPTGDRELDRIVAALNLAGERLEAAQGNAAALAARMALSERLAALGRVAAGVAHEIRNPVAAMRLKAENALAGDDARRRAALSAILSQIARLDRLTDELLTMTQQRTPAPEAIDLRALLQACAADHAAPGKDVLVQAEPALVTVDAGLLRRALDNLLDNALRHIEPGGAVTLSGAVTGGKLEISVADSGPGVAPELRANLFEPFVTGRADGTGLGLAIARQLVEAQGGSLVLTHPGPGAVFTLTVPACP
jgi:signal transduction histidine kinase